MTPDDFPIALVLLGLALLVALALILSLRGAYPWRGVPRLVRAKENPVLHPELGRGWDDRAVFNPGAIDIDGTVRLVFRALGEEGISRLGVAEARDAVTISERLLYPIFAAHDPRNSRSPAKYDRTLYRSGGGWGGTEDPRITKIDDTIYITFNMFDGWDFLRVAAISIRADDFKAKRWKFSDLLFLSPFGEIHKNWVLFPEKFGGKFAILHSISPEVQVDYVDALEELHDGATIIKSRHGQTGIRSGWDTWLRSAGPPPIKTERGWLILYHAIESNDPSRYKLGAMLLDKNDPRKVISRSARPILAPDMWYENEWKHGVVYACGAVVRGGTLFVYYGGGDQTVNVASMRLSTLLDSLVGEKPGA